MSLSPSAHFQVASHSPLPHSMGDFGSSQSLLVSIQWNKVCEVPRVCEWSLQLPPLLCWAGRGHEKGVPSARSLFTSSILIFLLPHCLRERVVSIMKYVKCHSIISEKAAFITQTNDKINSQIEILKNNVLLVIPATSLSVVHPNHSSLICVCLSRQLPSKGDFDSTNFRQGKKFLKTESFYVQLLHHIRVYIIPGEHLSVHTSLGMH